MERTNAVFLVVVALSALLGASVVAGFGSDLQTTETISVVEDRLATDVTDVTLESESLLVTVEIQNPTRYDFRVTGSHFRVYNDSEPQLAYTSGHRIDDGDDVLPGRDSLSVRYRVPLTPSQADRLDGALQAGDAMLTGSHGLRLNDAQFNTQIDPVALTQDGDGA